jgi:RecX family.
MRVLRDLGQRKVGSTVAQKAVEQIFEGADETAMVEEFLARKFRNQKLSEYLQEPKHLAAAFRRLRYAGFSSTVSIRVLKKYAAQAEDLESLDEPDTEAVE